MEFAAAHTKSPTDYSVQEILGHIFDNEPDGKEIQSRIASVRARLWDAPVLATETRNLLDERFTSWVHDPAQRALPLALRADLANLALPLAKLEAADLYMSA